ncbi:hipa-like c-terminal domain protein [Pseudomonas knackmussii B13]|uniref:Hipa-like c-terminal domain protein n=1 Tax=Pseudomonas knackmussii (strain DSM 6978 / CCUG 54928 / LMG 23759 / B13) TaxID=1301098 RepID=A0A024HM56_PSEKB|nr:HipA domain-containing protein [Pseudomonas knackmussii]CDF85729.1 hipa-like c-terminal domain protein [Pseudomonas knackmussii B13]
MPKELTVQVFADGTWQDAYSLKFEDPIDPREGTCISGYLIDFYLKNMEHEDSYLAHSVSVVHRLDMNISSSKGYPAFLLDIIPAGAAFRSLKKRFAAIKPDDVALELFLLERCTPSPIGHMRIKESLPYLDEGEPMGFTRQEVAERNADFLEYAYEQGAAIGGATGAGGEAPKLLLAENHNGLMFAEATLPVDQTTRHWFVKFPRGRAAAIDKDILRAEYQYYRAITEIGMNTISTNGLELIDDGEHRPSLWMPRFDREVTPHGILRHPIESIYSVCGVTENGAFLGHEFVMIRLLETWFAAGQDDEILDLAIEYISRDLLNRILGNSDNHGRNISIIRDGGKLKLAPIYDLAPMVLDPDGISRVLKWEGEKAGAPDWWEACHSIFDTQTGDEVYEGVRQAAQRFRALPDLLVNLPESVRNAQIIPLNNLDTRLKEWGLM